MIADLSGLPETLANERRSILVVEDEILLRMVVVEDLLRAGYSVLEAATAEEAIAILDSGAQIDLVFSDIQMPGALDGLGLLRVVKERFPSVPVVLTSGHVKPPREAIGEDTIFVPKPYFSGDLFHVFANAIEGGQGFDASSI